MMFLLDAVYYLVEVRSDGTVVLQNASTGARIVRRVAVDLNDGLLRIAESEADPGGLQSRCP